MSRLTIGLLCLASFVVVHLATLAQEQPEGRKPERRESDVELSSMSWAEIVPYLFQSLEEPNDKERGAYSDRLRTLLDRKGVSHIRCSATTDGKMSQRADIYYKPGELHVVNTPPAGASKQGEWNLVVKDGKAYEWRNGETQGIVSKAIDRDMIEYLIYLTDPAVFLTQTHRDFLRRPEAFFPPKKGKQKRWTELKYKKPHELGITALFVGEDPFWIYGIQLINDDATVRMTFDRPLSDETIPADLFDRLQDIQFKESTLSLRRHMTYL